MIRPFNWKVLILLKSAVLFWSSVTYGQIAFPSMFSGERSYNPAAVVLREDSSVSYRQIQGSGETVTSGSTSTEEITISRSALFGNLKKTDWGLEVFMDLESKEEIETKNSSNSYVATSGNTYKNEVSEQAVYYGTQSSQELNWGANLNRINTSNEDFEIDDYEQIIGGGITYQLQDGISIGTGLNYVMSDQTGKVTNNWFEYYLGAGLLIESGPESNFRLEAALIASPEDGETGSGELASNNHRAENRTYFTGEFSTQKFKLMYKIETYTVQPLSTRSSESVDETQSSTMGGGFYSDTPNFFIEFFMHSSERKRSEKTTTETDLMEIRIGTLF